MYRKIFASLLGLIITVALFIVYLFTMVGYIVSGIFAYFITQVIAIKFEDAVLFVNILSFALVLSFVTFSIYKYLNKKNKF